MLSNDKDTRVRVLKMRMKAGMSVPEIARAMRASTADVSRSLRSDGKFRKLNKPSRTPVLTRKQAKEIRSVLFAERYATFKEIADIVGVSTATVQRIWDGEYFDKNLAA